MIATTPTTRNAKLASAAFDAILMHQAEGKGLKPVADWTDADVTDSTLIFEALSNNGLATSDANESKLDPLVSSIVFGAFHQCEMSIEESAALLRDIGIEVAVLKWNTVATHTVCPITGEDIYPSFGYYPFINDQPISMEAFDAETRERADEIIKKHDWRDTVPAQHIAAYFLARKEAV